MQRFILSTDIKGKKTVYRRENLHKITSLTALSAANRSEKSGKPVNQAAAAATKMILSSH
ncbi:hypothetical protein LVJ83_06470 [Uruburuella testudinis]|uniref:Uncharacterized protein n=1 Tax=Uruburuella testudinis TaxID=1282863 RepID=A0ABY4DX88_9NEIS|nr:hypothetical protein [Uruburuella testudinis]UOO83098.1 hypothetical protein LVJ83_06470 [Uruburuella testudinis]